LEALGTKILVQSLHFTIQFRSHIMIIWPQTNFTCQAHKTIIICLSNLSQLHMI